MRGSKRLPFPWRWAEPSRWPGGAASPAPRRRFIIYQESNLAGYVLSAARIQYGKVSHKHLSQRVFSKYEYTFLISAELIR